MIGHIRRMTMNLYSSHEGSGHSVVELTLDNLAANHMPSDGDVIVIYKADHIT